MQELFAFSAHYTGTDSSRVPADDEMDEDILHAATVSSEYLSNRASMCKCTDTRLKVLVLQRECFPDLHSYPDTRVAT